MEAEIGCENIDPKLLGRLILFNWDVFNNFNDGNTKNLLCDVCNRVSIHIDAHFKI